MKRKIDPNSLLESESEILKRIASDVIDSEISEVMAGHFSSTSGHRSGSTHNSHASAIREKIGQSDIDSRK